jgi:hypothetical protein
VARGNFSGKLFSLFRINGIWCCRIITEKDSKTGGGKSLEVGQENAWTGLAWPFDGFGAFGIWSKSKPSALYWRGQ